MKKCRYCQTISAVPQESEIESTVCRFCGNFEFVDISEDELYQTMKRLTRLERCCPNPACAPKLLTNEDNYCSRCGRATEKTSLDLWIQKCLKPVFIVDPARLFTETGIFIEAARKMGFPGERSTAKLEEIIRQWTAQSFSVVTGWIARIKEALDGFSADFYAGRRSSQKMYRAARNGKTVVAFMLEINKNSRLKPGPKQIVFTTNSNGKYIGFYNKANPKQLWIYPISNLEFSECDFNAVFPDLTKEIYKAGSIEPQKAFIIDDGDPKIWVLSSITESCKRLIPELTALADEKGIEAELSGKILKSFFP